MEILHEVAMPLTHNLALPFCVKVDDHYFPTRDWEDFAFPIIIDWLDCVEKLCKQTEGCEKLFFMNGAYYILCNKKHRFVTLYGYRLDEYEPYFEYACELSDLYQTIWNAGAELTKQMSVLAPDIAERDHYVSYLYAKVFV